MLKGLDFLVLQTRGKPLKIFFKAGVILSCSCFKRLLWLLGRELIAGVPEEARQEEAAPVV